MDILTKGGASALEKSPIFAAEVSDTRLSTVHIGALDGLRGIAILLVLVHHYGRNARGFGMYHPLLSATEFGWCGVDLFFVLSGFLITGILYDSRSSPNYYRNFYARRILRIFPLYYAALLVVILLSVLWPTAGIWGTASPLWIALYLTNVAMGAEGPESVGVLGHYWSLAVEEHFYLMWPFLVLLGTRRQLIVAASMLIVWTLALRTWLVMGGFDPKILYVQTPLRMDSLAVGALVSLAVRGPAGIAGLVRPAWIAVLACGAAVLFIIRSRETYEAYDPVMQSIGYSLIAFGFAGALVIGISWKPASAVLNLGILRWLGRYSYGMYVWHPIVNAILFFTSLKTVFGVDSPAEGASYILFAIVLMTLVSLCSYHFLEQPFLRLKKHFT